MKRMSVVSRRAVVRGLGALALWAPAACLTACGSVDSTDETDAAGSAAAGSTEESQVEDTAPEESATEVASQDASASSVLVAYFSATGNTARVAHVIADHLGAPLFEIAPAMPYSADDLAYQDSSSRVSV